MLATQTSVYKSDGVNVSLGDKFSTFAGQICRETYENNRYIKVHDFSGGYFRGPRGFTAVNLPEGTVFDLAPDGVGTKVTVTDAAFTHSQSNRDWVEMCAGDILRWGGKPALLVNDLNVRSLGEDDQSKSYSVARELMTGLKQTADQLGYVIFKGETAEVGKCVSSENPNVCLAYLWSGVAFGFYNPKNLITGKTLAPGQIVVALREYGFRSNGISTVRKAFERKFGPSWYTSSEAHEYLLHAAQPSTLYDVFLSDVNGWSSPTLEPHVKMHLIVHLTGGSFKDKFFKDILWRSNLSAHLHDLWAPPDIMRQCAEWRGMTPFDFYQTLNGGQGMLVVIDEGDLLRFLEIARHFGIEAQACGVIKPAAPEPCLVINSKYGDGQPVKYDPSTLSA